MEATLILAALSLLAWSYLVFAHGRFWVGSERLDDRHDPPPVWPEVIAVVPARNEADVIERTVGSLLQQDYPGSFRIVLVDDESSDGTAEAAARAAAAHPQGERLRMVRTEPRPPGWVGKMWALETGTSRAGAEAPEYWLLTDADVLHSTRNLRRLVAKAEAERLDLVSLMVLLHSGHGWDRLLVPAFVYFFQKLFPFPRVNDPRSRTAGAAGGCVLVRRAALARAGGIVALRGEIIDDCALGRAVKRGGGGIWLGLTDSERSIRPYDGIAGVWHMVARSAFTQLGYSWPLLAGTVLGLVLLYLVPPLLYLVPPLLVLGLPLHGSASAAALAAAAWVAQAISFVPTLSLYRRAPLWGLALPLAGLLYTGMTLDSARRHARDEGAVWKGRPGAGRSLAGDP